MLAKRPLEAMDDFRIAAFGFLDRPAPLMDATMRLALAESAAAQTVELGKTLDRFLDLEARFGLYASTADVAMRKEFEELLIKNVPTARIAEVATLKSLLPPPPVPKGKKKSEPTPPSVAGDKKPSTAVPVVVAPVDPLAAAKAAALKNDHRAVIRETTEALKKDSALREAYALRGHARFASNDFAAAVADFDQVPDATFVARPELVGDLFVSLVVIKSDQRATALSTTLPTAISTRRDVVTAKSELQKRQPKPVAPAASVSSTAGRSTAQTPPPPTSAPATRPSTAAAVAASPTGADSALQEAQRLIQAGRPGEAERVLYDVVAQNPGRRDLRLALLEASCLYSDWKTANSQLTLLLPFRDGEEVSTFYAAVVSYENGRFDDAKKFLAASVDRVPQRGYVQYYAAKIRAASR